MTPKFYFGPLDDGFSDVFEWGDGLGETDADKATGGVLIGKGRIHASCFIEVLQVRSIRLTHHRSMYLSRFLIRPPREAHHLKMKYELIRAFGFRRERVSVAEADIGAALRILIADGVVGVVEISSHN